jgi:hypothetical protein
MVNSYGQLARPGITTIWQRKKLDAYVVNYADDLVICCRSFMVARGNGRREIATGQPSLFFTQAAQHTAIQEETR